MEDLSTEKRSHRLTLSNRHRCTLSGVCDVLSFDTNEIRLETEQGMLTIGGKELHVSRLTLEQGEVDIEGTVDSFTYSDTGLSGARQESLLTRLFR